MIQLIYSNVDMFSEFFTITVNNIEVAKYHCYFDDWSYYKYSTRRWIDLDGNINPIRIAKEIADDLHLKLQMCTETSIGTIVSTLL